MKVESTASGVRIQVKVVPNSSRSQVAGVLGEAVKVKVAQPPEEGKANRGVEELLAAVLGVARGNVRVVGGMTRALKVVEVLGIGEEEVRRKLLGPCSYAAEANTVRPHIRRNSSGRRH